MCGIAGWNLTEKPSEVFALTLGQAMVERGEDSWGYFDGENIHKDIGPLSQGIRAADMVSMAGFLHTRHATTGKKTKENSHPFKIGNIVGAHNGVIHNHNEIAKQYGRKDAVDSMHIFRHMIEEKPLTELEGYGAIQFYQDGKWYIGACNQGNLEVARLKDGKGLVWASTTEAILSAVYQGGYALDTWYKIKQGKIYRVETDELWNTPKVFNLGIHIFPAIAASYGKCNDRYLTSHKSSGDSKKSQEEWWRNTTTDYPGESSEYGRELADLLFTDAETFIDDCEWCGEKSEVVEQYGAFLCKECVKLVA